MLDGIGGLWGVTPCSEVNERKQSYFNPLANLNNIKSHAVIFDHLIIIFCPAVFLSKNRDFLQEKFALKYK